MDHVIIQESQWQVVLEAIPLLSFHKSIPITPGIRSVLTGCKSPQLLSTLLANLKKHLQQKDYIGSVQWNLKIRSLLKRLNDVKPGETRRALILKDARELQFRLETTASKMTLVSTILHDLSGVCSALHKRVVRKFTGRLYRLNLCVKPLNALKRVLREIIHYTGTPYLEHLPASLNHLKAILVGIGNSAWPKSINGNLKGLQFFCGGVLTLAKLALPSHTSTDQYLSGISTMLKKLQKRQMDLFSMICHSHTGPGLPVFTSSTSNMKAHYRRGMLPPQSGRDYHDFSPQTKHLIMFSTLRELVENCSRRLFADERKGTMYLHHSLSLSKYLDLSTGTYANVSVALQKYYLGEHAMFDIDMMNRFVWK